MITSTFNLNEIPAPRRLKYWQDAICKTYITVDCKKLSDNSIDGAISARMLGSPELSEVTSPPMAYSRGKEQLRGSQSDCFQLVLAVEGKGIVEQGNRRTRFKPGDMVIYSSMEASTVAYPEGSTTQVVKIPSALLVDRVRSTDGIGATPVDGSTALGSMTRRPCLPNIVNSSRAIVSPRCSLGSRG